jgi:uncharacterized protein (TIGR00375 family)
MQYFADLHLHSRYSRAVSQQMNLTATAKAASEKGIDLLSAADWTHPLWLKEITTQLEEAGEGVYRLKQRTDSGEQREPVFVLATEIACIYKQADKLRRIHTLVFAPDFAAVAAINQALIRRGANLSSDGRPIIGLSVHDLLELVLEASDEAFLIPCHVWTPHFGLYGSASGFASIEEAFGDLSGSIYAIETGLSSDPAMNWEVPELYNRSIVSFSDAHSLPKMGRELTAFELEVLDFPHLKAAVNRASSEQEHNHIVSTVEFYPEEGKYHYSGHRNCKVRLGPEEIREQGTTCPVCGRRLTEGVFLRVQQVAGTANFANPETKIDDHGVTWYTDPKQHHPPYVKLVPLLEVVAEAVGTRVQSKKAQQLYGKMLSQLGSELTILLRAELVRISEVGGERISEAITKVRSGAIVINPGFDGEYGKVSIWSEQEKAQQDTPPQLGLDL